MDFPPRGTSSRGRGEDLEIGFEPLRSPTEPSTTRRRPQRRRGLRRGRPRREPGPPRQRRPGSETIARIIGVIPWLAFEVIVVALGRLLFAAAMAAFACVGLAVLVGAFFADTFASLAGRLFVRRPPAPRLSPRKTLEGLVIGIVDGTMAFWFAGLYQDWLSGIDALVIGFCVAIAAPVGDLFE